MILAFFTASAAQIDCDNLKGGLAQDECSLSQSMEIAADCVKRESQADMNICSFRDYLRSDIELNHAWDAVTKRLRGQQKIFDTLLAGQRAWLTYREKQCDVWAKWYEGGTIASLMINSCLTDITKFRTKELNQLLEDN